MWFSRKNIQNALIKLIKKENLTFQTEKEIDVYFEGEKVGKFRCDLIVENRVIVELKLISGRIPLLFEHQL